MLGLVQQQEMDMDRLAQYDDEVLLSTAKSCGFDEDSRLARFMDFETPLSTKERKWLVGHLTHPDMGDVADRIAAAIHKQHQDPAHQAFMAAQRARLAAL